LDRPGVLGADFDPVGLGVQRSALLVAILLLVIIVFMFRNGVLSSSGWCLGFAGGAALAEFALNPQLRTSAVLILSCGVILWVVQCLPLLRFAVSRGERAHHRASS
jgi:hypothetical protein